MGAELCIHVYKGLTEQDFKIFFANSMGSKYFRGFGGGYTVAQHETLGYDEILKKIMDTPSVSVGDWSPLKAALFDDDKFLPTPLEKIQEIIGEDLPVIDNEMIEKIGNALGLENTTYYDVSSDVPIVSFLMKHRGEQVFTMSW